MVARRSITIRKERFYPHPPEDVWAAVTDPHALAEWLEPNNHQPIVGHKFQFRCDPGMCGSGFEPAVSNASTLAPDGRVIPLTLRTYWRAAASISSPVADGSSPRNSVMFRHMTSTIGR